MSRPTAPHRPSRKGEPVALPDWVHRFTWFPQMDGRLDEPAEEPAPADVTFGPRDAASRVTKIKP